MRCCSSAGIVPSSATNDNILCATFDAASDSAIDSAIGFARLPGQQPPPPADLVGDQIAGRKPASKRRLALTLGRRIEQVEGAVAQVSADGAYDTEGCHRSIAERGAKATIPPRDGAVPWGDDHPRDAILQAIAERGRDGWKDDSHYHRRSLAENMMSGTIRVTGTYDGGGEALTALLGGHADAMTAAWAGIYDTDKIGIMLDHRHKTMENIKETGAFTVSMATLKTMAEADYFGTVSGHKVKGKIEKAGFHAVKSEHVDAPVIEEFPLTFECKVVKTTQESEDWYIVGEIVNILADESVLTGVAI